MYKKLDQKYFRENAVKAAKNLLGKYLVRKTGKETIALMITEVEAYDGPHDRASHASKGETARTKIMFGQAGYFYVYLCYGMHWMLNIVTGPKGYPAAVLIRGAGEMDGPGNSPQNSPKAGLLNGPAKLTKYLKIDKNFNGKKVAPESGLWVEDRGVKISANKIKKGPRVGVAYAGPVWAKKHYRFWI